MILDDVLFLAARTTRSQAYAQAMVQAGLAPAHVIVYGAEKSGRLGQSARRFDCQDMEGLFLPDLSEPLEASLETLGRPVSFVTDGAVASPAVMAQLDSHPANLVIYSGYGSEIVPAPLCEKYRLLHIHCGWLPDYRGSTTIYYSLLQENRCGASAIFLAATIDTGPMLSRRRYPPPPKGLDIDYIYDNAVRADLLVRVLGEYARNDGRLDTTAQPEGEGKTYYVIHPVLKNIVLEKIAST